MEYNAGEWDRVSEHQLGWYWTTDDERMSAFEDNQEGTCFYAWPGSIEDHDRLMPYHTPCLPTLEAAILALEDVPF